MDLKQALVELLGDADEEIIGIRSGEKLREILIGEEEIRYAWNIKNKYMISNPIFDDEIIKLKYPGIKHLEKLGEYSSDKVEKISKEELKSLIHELGIIK